MTIPAETLSEQLSAFMDGELPEAQARFLMRRLEHDAALRATWERMHVAASCLRNQPWQPARANLGAEVAAQLTPAAGAHGSRPLLRWAMVASVAALALMFAPRLMHSGTSSAPVVASAAARPAADHTLASPASADLVAMSGTENGGGEAPAPSEPPAPSVVASSARSTELIAQTSDRSAKESPLPLSAQSPSDFPLVDTGDKRNWPRSELIGAASDPAIEAYLVRHNQMIANDGLGGFVPYVDVVARQPQDAASSADASSQDAGAEQK